jgi:uncharacterized protein YecE (DUF72 family)
MTQLRLFESAREPDFTHARSLAERVPKHVRFGTSSWTFPGWSGIVYPESTEEETLRTRGLELYCRHPLFTTVGIDSSYYRPLDDASLMRYRAQLPSGFQCVSKVFNQVTTLADPRTHQPNPHFLDAAYFEREVLAPLERSFHEHLGPLVFEFPPLRHPHWLEADEFCTWLDRFFSKVSRSFPYAVELRNRELLTPRYRDALQRHGLAHVMNFWEQMPVLREQMECVDLAAAPFGICRLLIPPGKSYARQKQSFEPFDRIVEPQLAMRSDVAQLVQRFSELERVLFVIVNNKAEGSSPLTILALADYISAEPIFK